MVLPGDGRGGRPLGVLLGELLVLSVGEGIFLTGRECNDTFLLDENGLTVISVSDKLG